MIPRKVVPGMSTRLDTRGYGDIADSVQDLRDRQAQVQVADSRGLYRNPAVVLAKNLTYDDFPRYSIVALNRAGISSEDNSNGDFNFICYHVSFTSGGPTEILEGYMLTGETSGAEAIVYGITTDGGDWGAGTAIGILKVLFISCQKNFEEGGENLLLGVVDNCTVDGNQQQTSDTGVSILESHNVYNRPSDSSGGKERSIDLQTFLQQPYFAANHPTYEDQLHLGVTLEPMDHDRVAQVAVAGIVQCKVNILYEKHMYAHIDIHGRSTYDPCHPDVMGEDYGGHRSLTSSHWGPVSIIYKPRGTGIKWCLVQLGVPSMFRRFEMTEPLYLPQSGHGTAWVTEFDWAEFGGGAGSENWQYNLGEGKGHTPIRDHYSEFFVTDTLRMHSKMATQTGLVGAYGVAWWPHDKPRAESFFEGSASYHPWDRCWEILTMQTPGPFYGIAQNAFTQGSASVSVRVVGVTNTPGHMTTGGYDPFFPGVFEFPTVYNPPQASAAFDGTPEGGPFWFAGDGGAGVNEEDAQMLYCEWDMRQSRYYIKSIEPIAVALTDEGVSVGVLWAK